MSGLFKTDRSHSEVGDTLRYFNSVSTSKSWCGDAFYDGDSYSVSVATAAYKRHNHISGILANPCSISLPPHVSVLLA